MSNNQVPMLKLTSLEILFVYLRRQIDDSSDDFTLSYLDGVVVSALEKSGAFAECVRSNTESFKPYMPNRSWKFRAKIEKEKMV